MPEMLYKDWIIAEATKAGSDKCTMASDWNVWCCLQHDLACHFGKDPRDAYRLWCDGELEYWLDAGDQSRRNADKIFWRCNRQTAPTLVGKLRSDVRYLGVRIGALWPF